MTVIVEIYQRTQAIIPTPAPQLKQWISHTIAHVHPQESRQRWHLSLSFVDEAESEKLNAEYRQKKYPTNILSFPHGDDFPLPRRAKTKHLGDLLVCVPVLIQEASTQKISTEHHLAHLLVHGTLHLLGFDHENSTDAETMEQHEITILHHFNIANPYRD